MFTTYNTWKSTKHDFLCTPSQQFWTSVELGLKKPWFVMTVSQTESSEGSEGIEYLRDFMVANVADIEIFAQEDVTGRHRLVSAMIVIPNAKSGAGAWSMEPLAAIWAADEPEAPGAPVEICETQSGAKFVTTFGACSLEKLTNQTLLYRFPVHENTI